MPTKIAREPGWRAQLRGLVAKEGLGARLLLVLAAAYVIEFFARQSPHLFDTHFLEWDARAMALTAFRFHGSGLLANDLPTDLSAAMCPPGWKLLYWLGTLVTDAYMVTKLLPFALFAFALVHGYRFGRHFGGPVLGATVVVLLVHCNQLWDRILGANPRGFGFPLVIAFVRYAVTGNELAALAVLIAQAAFYPSVALFCGLAWGLTCLAPHPDRPRRLLRVAVTGLIVLALVAPTAWFVSPQLGKPISIEQLATLGQRANWSLYPLPPSVLAIERALKVGFFEPYAPFRLPRWEISWLNEGGLAFALAGALCALAGRAGLRKLSLVYPAMFFSSYLAFRVAEALAYRLYVPDRMLLYAWPPLVLLGLPVIAHEAFRRYSERHAATLAGVVLVGFQLAFYGTGLPSLYGVHDWSPRDTTTTHFLAGLPKETTIAAGVDASSYIQVFALRKTLFSGITNAPNFYEYGAEIERRIGAYYHAYYARDLETLRRWAKESGAEYLVADQRDFGPQASFRARYFEPWTTLGQRLIGAGPVDGMVLAHPPAGAIVFKDGNSFVLDLKKL